MFATRMRYYSIEDWSHFHRWGSIRTDLKSVLRRNLMHFRGIRITISRLNLDHTCDRGLSQIRPKSAPGLFWNSMASLSLLKLKIGMRFLGNDQQNWFRRLKNRQKFFTIETIICKEMVNKWVRISLFEMRKCELKIWKNWLPETLGELRKWHI